MKDDQYGAGIAAETLHYAVISAQVQKELTAAIETFGETRDRHFRRKGKS